MPATAPSPAEKATVLPRVLIVDDSAVARAVLSRMVGDSGAFAVAAAVPDVDRALSFLADASVVAPIDAIVLDLEMPGTDGLTALPRLIAAGKGARVLIVSSSCGDGAAATVRALALGAADTLEKPGSGAFAGRFAEALVDRLTRLAEHEEAVPVPPSAALQRDRPFDLVAIGASTGGIHALSGLLRAIPRDYARPIVITQHLPASFTPYFAAQISQIARRPCAVAADHMAIQPGQIVVAPGDAHVVAVKLPSGQGALRLSTVPVANGNMPSVDPMFSTLAAVYGPRLLAIVLSGMGRDGLDGARDVRAAGGTVIVQDQASSVVWGMPGAVAGEGLAHAILPPAAIGAFVVGGADA